MSLSSLHTKKKRLSIHPASRSCCLSSCANVAPYVCPRCGQPYCSVSCYRSHSQRCVDSFAKNSLHSLRGLTASSINRKSFNDMLERIRNHTDVLSPGESHYNYTDSSNESDDIRDNAKAQTPCHADEHDAYDLSEEVHILEQLLMSLDEPRREALFTVLNSAMENAYGHDTVSPQLFARFDSSSNTEPCARQPNIPKCNDEVQNVADTLQLLVEEMETLDLSYDEVLSRLPNFLRKDFEKCVHEGSIDRLVTVWTPWWQQIEDPERNDSEQLQKPPSLPSLPTSDHLLVPLNIARQKASPYLQYCLVDVLAGYTFSLRVCNGEWWSDSYAARTLWQTSSVLSGDSRYTSAEEVCRAVTKRIAQNESHPIAIQALQDTSNILSGRSDWVARALYECQCVLETGLTTAGSRKHKIRKGVRKVGFFVAWAMCQGSEVYEHLARTVLSYAKLEDGLAEEVKMAARVVQAHRKPKISTIQ